MPGARFPALSPLVLVLSAFLAFPGMARGDSTAFRSSTATVRSPVAAGAPSLFEVGWCNAGMAAIALGLGTLAQVRFRDMPAASSAELDRDDLWAIDRWAAGAWSPEAARTSDHLLRPLLVAPMALSAWEARRSGAGWSPVLADLLVYSEALALSSSLNLLVRSSRIHPRPFQFGTLAPASERSKGEASGSFYSGHANASFLAATYLAYTHGLRHPGSPHAPWIWAGAIGYASAVSTLRVAAGKHFPSDILAGAAAGAFFGWLFPRIHLRGGTPAPGAASLRLLPAAHGGAQALLVKRF